jgi:hypothetical protein
MYNININEIYISNERIIKVQEVKDNVAIGYDLITESVVKIHCKYLTKLPEVFHKILANEDLRIQLSHILSDTNEEGAKLCGLSTRTFFRHLKRLKLTQFDEEI